MVARSPEAAKVSACLGRLEAGLLDPVATVTALADIPPEILDAALRGLTQQRGQDVLPLLSALADRGPTKDARKLARRALYRLAQAGFRLPAKTAEPAVKARVPHAARAWASGIDGSGSRGVWILLEGAYGGWELCSLIINDRAGILEATGGAISKKRLNAELKALGDAGGLPWVEIPAFRAVGLVVEALERHDPTAPPPREFARWRALFAPAVGAEEGSVAASSDPSWLEEIRHDLTLVDHSAELLELPELGGWFLDPELVQADAVELLQARESRLVLSEQIKAEREAGIVERVVGREFSGEVRQRWARRLIEMSWIFQATERRRLAQIAYAAAFALTESSRPLHHIPFVRALAQRGLELACEVALGRVSASEVSRAPRQAQRSR